MGYAGREFAAEVEARFAAEVLRPSRKDEPDFPIHLAMIRQRIGSVFWTLKDRLGLERHHARVGPYRREAPGSRRRGLGQQPARTAGQVLRPVRRLRVEPII
jgi:hypothetical protein